MLASINPLVERARGNRYWHAVGPLIVGSALGGLLTGGLCGAMGQALFSGVGVSIRDRVLTLGVAAVVGVALDRGYRSVRLPTSRRQVNQGWLVTYRPHIYGFGFGIQLGTGIATIVTSSAIYLQMLAAFLSGSAWLGMAMGVFFGSVRGLGALPAARVRAPSDLGSLTATLERLNSTTRRVAGFSQMYTAAALITLALV